jgi:RNA polymerase sigma-70 factor (ECF subfamily)
MEKDVVRQYYTQYADTVMKAAWHFTGSVHTAQDCAQEAFLRLMQEDLMPDSKILPWLICTAVNLAKDSHRRRERAKAVTLDEAIDMPADNDELLAERAAQRAMLSLPEKYRLPLLLNLVQGYTIQQTAKIIGKGANTTASLIRRGKKLFAKAYEKECV